LCWLLRCEGSFRNGVKACWLPLCRAISWRFFGEDMTNHDRIAAVFRSYRGREFATSEIKMMLQGNVTLGSVLPNDHADADHDGCCWCAGTEDRIFKRVGPGRYRVWDERLRPNRDRVAKEDERVQLITVVVEEPEGYPMVAQLDEIVERLMSREAVAFDPSKRKDVPTSHGLYAIHTTKGVCLHAGRTRTANLQHRLFTQHYAGGGKGAGSDLVQKIQSKNVTDSKTSAQKWIRINCVVRWLEVPDSVTRHWAEHRLLSYLRPIWCVPKE
jgi:hypothetical protein